MNKKKQMYYYVSWFQVHYPELTKEMMSSMHNYSSSELNPYHLESDCWSHTMMVCKLAELFRYETVVLVAALLHDVGKPAVRKVNPKNNHVQFFGHEEVSAEIAAPILDRMIDERMIEKKEKEIILSLIREHAFLYKTQDVEEMLVYFDGDKRFCKQLIYLIKCDSLGRFAADLSDEKRFDDLIQQLDRAE